MVVSEHAIMRFQERVANVSDTKARAALSSQAICKAIAFGARYVRLGTGHRIVIKNETIVTVLPLEARNKFHMIRKDEA